VGAAVKIIGHELGAEVYGYYQLLSQLAAFYAYALQIEQDVERKKVWDSLGESVIEDLCHVYRVWELVRNQSNGRATSQVDVLVRISHTGPRFSKIQSLLNLWVPMLRMIRVFEFAERKCLAIITRFDAKAAGVEGEIETSKYASAQRMLILSKIRSEFLNQRQAMEKNFAIPVSLLAGGTGTSGNG